MQTFLKSLIKRMDQQVQLTKSIKSLSPKIFHNKENFYLKFQDIIKDILADGCRLQLSFQLKKFIIVEKSWGKLILLSSQLCWLIYGLKYLDKSSHFF